MPTGIIQYLTKEETTWDNRLMKGMCLVLMFNVFLATKQDVRPAGPKRVRRGKTEWLIEPEDDDNGMPTGEDHRRFRKAVDSLTSSPEYKMKLKLRERWERKRSKGLKEFKGVPEEYVFH